MLRAVSFVADLNQEQEGRSGTGSKRTGSTLVPGLTTVSIDR